MPEHRCLPEVMATCQDCDGPECAYQPGSQCEERNLNFLSPDVRKELEAYRATGLSLEVLSEFAPFLLEMKKNLGAMRYLKELTQAAKKGRLVVLPEGKAQWIKVILECSGVAQSTTVNLGRLNQQGTVGVQEGQGNEP